MHARNLAVALGGAFTVGLASFVQGQSAGGAVAGPNLKRTLDWLEDQLPVYGKFQVISADAAGARRVDTYGIERVKLSNCQARLTPTRRFNDIEVPKVEYTVNLKGVDAEKIRATEMRPAPGSKANRPSYMLALRPLRDGAPFAREVLGKHDTSSFVPLFVGDDSSAAKIVNAFKHAAALCGAPRPEALQAAAIHGRYVDRIGGNVIELQSDGTYKVQVQQVTETGAFAVVGDTVKLARSSGAAIQGYLSGNGLLFDTWHVFERAKDSESAGQTAATSSRPDSTQASVKQPSKGMTNSDVVKLVASGLSSDVVATAIRQEGTTTFNLSLDSLLALKNAKVPDAVIRAMQDRNSQPAAPTPSPPKAEPKYDPTLTAPPKAAPPPNACDGIEVMGIYRGQLENGLLEWLGKIRNNTSVAKLVNFAWIDMYGEEKRGQVQLRGGDIATQRLDLTQPRPIAPVRNLHLVRCQ